MMAGAKYFMDLPVYRLPEADYYQDREKYIESILFPADNPTFAEGSHKQRETDRARFDLRYELFANSYGGPWPYNEIIGFIQLHFFGSQIRGDYWSHDAKRVVRTRTKRFKWQTHKLAPEMDLPRGGTNAEIFATVMRYVERCGHELEGRCIFTRDLEVLGPHLNWNGLLKDGSNYGPQKEHPGLTVRPHRRG